MTRFLVIGDTILDENVYAIGTGLSLETPTLKGSFRSRCFSLGGAANLVKHLRNFTKQIDFYTSCDDRGYEMLQELSINVIKCNETASQIKSRYWLERGDGQYKVLQINETKTLDNQLSILNQVKTEIDFQKYDRVLVSDYRLGLLSKDLVELVAKNAKLSFGASQMSDKEPNFSWFKNFDIVVCNEEEALFAKDCSNICITMGEKGCMFEGKIFPIEKVTCVSSIGAGDAFFAAFAFTQNPDSANKYVKNHLEGFGVKKNS